MSIATRDKATGLMGFPEAVKLPVDNPKALFDIRRGLASLTLSYLPEMLGVFRGGISPLLPFFLLDSRKGIQGI